MNKKFGWIVGTLMIALVAVGVVGTSVAYADDGGPERPFAQRGDGFDGKHGFGGRGLNGAALETVADLLDMSTDEVTAALEDGKTLPELAEEAGVDMQEIVNELKAAREESNVDREEAMRERIATAVEEGTMSQEQADWVLEGLEKGFLGNHRNFGRVGFERPERPVAE